MICPHCHQETETSIDELIERVETVKVKGRKYLFAKKTSIPRRYMYGYPKGKKRITQETRVIPLVIVERVK